MPSRGRRHSTGFGYIGFGNNQTTFNRKSKGAFSTYKEKLNLEAHLHYEMHFLHKDLSKVDKQKIKNKVRSEEQQLFIRTAIISLIIFCGIAYLAYYLIHQILSR
jgi:hypothetical protein